MDETTMFIGLDVHKATIAVAVAEGGHREAARYYGEIENSSAALSKLARSMDAQTSGLASAMRRVRAATGFIVTSSVSATSAWWSRRR